MNQERLSTAFEVLNELSGIFSDMPDNPGMSSSDNEKALNAASAMTIASFYLTELMIHLTQGEEPRTAMLLTIRGETPIGDPRDQGESHD